MARCRCPVCPASRITVERARLADFAERRGRRIAKLRRHRESAAHEERQNPQQQGPCAARGGRTLAVAALSFLASEPEHLGGFLAATGIGPDQIRNAARDRTFLSGVLDHFSGNEPLLIAFAQHAGIDPTEVERARVVARRRLGTGRAVMAAFCRDCLRDTGEAARCPACFSPRILRHPELDTLTICHVDCDAFYATIEKRDDPTPRRQAADHRRRQARRSLDRLLHRAHLRRALGDADVRGQAALPARHHRPPQHGKIRNRQPTGAHADARHDPAGRADLDRRGVHGPRPAPRGCTA